MKIKGYTLVELMITTGVLSLAGIGVYTLAMIAGDWRTSSQEVKSLNLVMQEINNATITNGVYTGITFGTLNSVSSGLNSNLQLMRIVSPESKKLNFEYSNISPRVCSNFTSKMLSSSNNIGAIINGKEITSSNLGEIVNACEAKGGLSDVTIVLNRDSNYTIDNVVASINPPVPSMPDIVIPTFGGPTTLPSVPGFLPSTANPVTYPLITGTPPTFGPVVGGEGNVTVTSPGGQVTPSNVYRPPATPAPPDALEQDPNPPPPPPPPADPYASWPINSTFICHMNCYDLGAYEIDWLSTGELIPNNINISYYYSSMFGQPQYHYVFSNLRNAGYKIYLVSKITGNPNNDVGKGFSFRICKAC